MYEYRSGRIFQRKCRINTQLPPINTQEKNIDVAAPPQSSCEGGSAAVKELLSKGQYTQKHTNCSQLMRKKGR